MTHNVAVQIREALAAGNNEALAALLPFHPPASWFSAKDLSRIELQQKADTVLQTMGIKGLEPVDFETAQYFIVEVARSSPCACACVRAATGPASCHERCLDCRHSVTSTRPSAHSSTTAA